MQSNLHLLDSTRNSNHIEFVSNLTEVKDAKISTNHTEEELAPTTYESRKVQRRKEAKQAALDQILRLNQSENKQEYKRLNDAVVKQNQLQKVSEALTLDKLLKQKGKKRKTEDGEGKVHYKWFSERKR